MKVQIIAGLTFLVLLTTFMLPMISAATDTQDVDDTFKINTAVDYSKPCFNNGTYCSGSATCNYSVFKPDNSVLINNQIGTNQGAYHNITFTPTEIGIYKVDMTCVDSGLAGAESFYFEATGSGFNDNIWFYVIVLGISAGIIIGGFALTDAPMVILGTFGLYFLGIYTLLNGIAGIRDLQTTWAIGIILLGVAGYVSIKSAWELINS